MKSSQWFRATIVAGIAAVLSGAAVASWRPPSRGDSAAASPMDSSEGVFRQEHEIVLLYVGRASCGWCRRPEMHVALDEAREVLRSRLIAAGWKFKTYGVGIDYSPQQSLDHLQRMGPFDAISAGDGWRSLAGSMLASGKLAGPRATPQLLVLRRLNRVSGPESNGFAEIISEQLLVRKVGLFEIQEWLADGAVIPPSPLRDDELAQRIN
jgi:hypothetical protein